MSANIVRHPLSGKSAQLIITDLEGLIIWEIKE
jgi:hypothetical protein